MAEKPIRVQLSRQKGWKMPENTVKVDRTTKWGNSIRIGEDISYYSEGVTSATAADAVELFQRFTRAHIDVNPDYLKPLRGKNLACWCKPGAPCHADVLLELANAPDHPRGVD